MKASELRLSEQEIEMIEILRLSPAPGEIIADARRCAGKQVANELTFDLQQLAKGPRREFWRTVQGGYVSFKGKAFGSLDDVIAEAVTCFGSLDEGCPVELSFHAVNGVVWYCFVQRGRYRVYVNFLPKWMERAWQARAQVPAASMARLQRFESSVRH